MAESTGDVEMEKIAEKTKRRKLNFVDKNMVQTGMLITVEKQEGQEPEGQIFNVHIPYSIGYKGYGELFLKMERIYNLLDRPQAEFEMRSWREIDWKDTGLENIEGWNFGDDCFEDFKKIYTSGKKWLYVETMFRCHGSWQGIIKTAQMDSLRYRSALELMHYISQYLYESGNK